jgi:hypothetical protein
MITFSTVAFYDHFFHPNTYLVKRSHIWTGESRGGRVQRVRIVRSRLNFNIYSKEVIETKLELLIFFFGLFLHFSIIFRKKSSFINILTFL